MADITWEYQKLDENGDIKTVTNYTNDLDGSITGHIVINVKAWFDENPEIRKLLGWVKYIRHNSDDIEYNKQTQFVTRVQKQIDEFTVEDEFYVLDKSEDQLAFEEMLSVASGAGSFVFF